MFPPEYQDELIARMTDRRFLTSCGKVIQPDWFDLDREPIVTKVLSSWRQGRVLSLRQITQLASRYNVKLKRMIQGDFSFDVEEVSRYASVRRLQDFSLVFRDLLGQGRVEDAMGALRGVKSLNVEGLNGQAGVDLFDPKRKVPKRTGIIPTGLDRLDQVLGGGVGHQDVSLILAPTNGGKTAWLCWVASQAIRLKKKVVYFTLDDGLYDIDLKLRRCLTGDVRMRGWKTWCRKKGKGRLSIHERARFTCSIQDIEESLNVEGQRSKVDLLIVDYPDCMKMPKTQQGGGLEYFALGELFGHLSRIAHQQELVVWVASQIQRSAYGEQADSSVVRGSIMKSEIADQVISIQASRTHGSWTRIELYVSKNKHGPSDQMIRSRVNWETCSFKENW